MTAQRLGDLTVLAFDHRLQLVALAARHARGAEHIIRFKRLIAEGARQGSGGTTGVGIILDDRYGEALLPAMSGTGWWVARPVERPGSRPLQFEAGPQIGETLAAWPAEHVAKCLVSHHPDDALALREQQLDQLLALQQACVATHRQCLIEIIPPADMPADAQTLARALEQIYAAGIHPQWWKLPPPASSEAWRQLEDTIARHDPQCSGVLLLGLDASEHHLHSGFLLAAPHAICRGFAVGRSIFGNAAAAWFDGQRSDAQVIAEVAARYARLITLWRDARASAAA